MSRAEGQAGRPPRILLDVDGPLTLGFLDLTCAILRGLGMKHAYPYVVDRWDMFAALRAPPDIEAAARERLRRPGVASSFSARAGAREFVAELQTWADVWAVTSPLRGSPTWAYEREVWLAESVGIPAKRMISIDEKHAVRGDALVEDKCANLIAWSAENPGGLCVFWREHTSREPWEGPSAGNYKELRAWLEALRKGLPQSEKRP